MAPQAKTRTPRWIAVRDDRSLPGPEWKLRNERWQIVRIHLEHCRNAMIQKPTEQGIGPSLDVLRRGRKSDSVVVLCT
jgi:hypothetical protein